MAINNQAKMEALEIEEELIEAIENTKPEGLNYKQGSELLGVEYNRFHQIASYLIRMRRIKGVHGARGVRLILPDWDEPDVYVISRRQRMALDYLMSLMDEHNLVRVSLNKIFQATGAAQDCIWRLDYKGYLEVVERGWSKGAALYKVYPNRDGPRGYSYDPWKQYSPNIKSSGSEQ